MPAETKKPAMVRVSLDLSPETFRKLEALEIMMDLDSKAAVLRQALKLTHALMEMRVEGWTIVLTSKDGREREVLVPK